MNRLQYPSVLSPTIEIVGFFFHKSYVLMGLPRFSIVNHFPNQKCLNLQLFNRQRILLHVCTGVTNEVFSGVLGFRSVET